jgi:AcrR family transcriptional regulator
MNAKERRERQKRETREAILNVACQLIAQGGAAGVTVRKIAEAVDYTPPIIYEHFENKEDILTALQSQWSLQMSTMVQNIYDEELPPKEALEKIVLSYFDFAYEHPEFYKAIMGIEFEFSSCGQFNSSPFQIIRLILKELIGNALSFSAAKRIDLDDAVELLRSYLHGICALFLLKRIKGGETRVRKLIRNGLSLYLKGWEA